MFSNEASLSIDDDWGDDVSIDHSSFVVENGLDDDDAAVVGPLGNLGNGEEAVAATSASPPRPFVVGLEENVDVVADVAAPSLDLLIIGVAPPPSSRFPFSITFPAGGVTNEVVVSAAFVRDKATEEACSITRFIRTC